MALEDFYPISVNPKETRGGLVWHGVVQEDKYFAELQTGVLPQLVHLVIFDMEQDNKPVYEALAAFEVGDSLDSSKLSELESAVQVGLAELNS